MKRRRIIWAIALPVTLAAVILGILVLVLVRYGPLQTAPWAYIAIPVTLTGAVASLLLFVQRGHDLTE